MPTLIILAVNAGLTSTSTYISDPHTRPSRPSASLPLHAQAQNRVIGTHLSFRPGGGLDTFGSTTRGSDVDLKDLKRQSTQSAGAQSQKKPELSEAGALELDPSELELGVRKNRNTQS